MRYQFFMPAVALALTLSACSEPLTPEPESGAAAVEGIALASHGSTEIPISFVTEFREFLGGEFSTHGASGRSRNLIGLSFSVQEGDLVGSMVTWLNSNDPSPQTGAQGTNGSFSTSNGVSTDYDVCMPALALCGTFSAVAGPGKVYPQPRGVQIPNSVAFGAGDFEGMKLQGTVSECADSQGNRGCFTGHLLIPANN
jgi:hypothetical protein